MVCLFCCVFGASLVVIMVLTMDCLELVGRVTECVHVCVGALVYVCMC